MNRDNIEDRAIEYSLRGFVCRRSIMLADNDNILNDGILHCKPKTKT
eukprot:XP_001706247.1 Hypothetical protein GL50803_116864 [Giardia lamblia ATCC 50803]